MARTASWRNTFLKHRVKAGDSPHLIRRARAALTAARPPIRRRSR